MQRSAWKQFKQTRLKKNDKKQQQEIKQQQFSKIGDKTYGIKMVRLTEKVC